MLTNYKNKKDKKDKKDKDDKKEPEIIVVYYNVYEKLINQLLSKNTTIIYLCADVHNYQNIQLTSKRYPKAILKIYVAGTGGASPDKIIKKEKLNDDLTNFEKFTSELIEINNPFGYCSVEISKHDSEFVVEYHKVKDINYKEKGVEKVKNIKYKEKDNSCTIL